MGFKDNLFLLPWGEVDNTQSHEDKQKHQLIPILSYPLNLYIRETIHEIGRGRKSYQTFDLDSFEGWKGKLVGATTIFL